MWLYAFVISSFDVASTNASGNAAVNVGGDCCVDAESLVMLLLLPMMLVVVGVIDVYLLWSFPHHQLWF